MSSSLMTARFFVTLSGSRRYTFLYRLHEARTPEARQAHRTYIAMLRERRTF